MKRMKKITLLFLLSAFLLIGTQSCKKYPDNQLINIRSRNYRIANTWSVENYKSDGIDLTSIVSGYTETFTTDGDYSYTWGILGGKGTWSFQNNDKEIQIIGIDNQENRVLYIQKLDEKEFWYYIMDGDKKNEYHMIHP